MQPAIVRPLILISSLLLSAVQARAQTYSSNNYGLNVGAVTALGNRFQRLGVTLQTFYYSGFAQFNTEVRVYHSFKSPGPARQYNDLVVSAGLTLGYGEKQTRLDPFLGTVSNQTKYTNSIGYSYNLYFNKIKTTQQTGIIALQFHQLSIITENDIFARPTLDRFRTGAILVQYQYKDQYLFGINCTLWTGQMGNKVRYSRGCYLDTTNGVYTNYSAGLLSAQFKVALNNGQTLQANAGIDAEQVRNFVQNRLIHDVINKSKNCEIPMLDAVGNQYLYRAGQEVKRVKPYWNVFTGAGYFY